MAKNGENGIGRTQPELSLGERMAALEAAVHGHWGQDNERESVSDKRLTETGLLFDQKLMGLRAEHQAALAAQKEAVIKVETVTDQRFTTAGTQAERREGLMNTRMDGLDTRLQTLERGESMNVGERTGIVSLQNRQIALVGVIIAVLTALILYHP
jgi:hypothetical protein